MSLLIVSIIALVYAVTGYALYRYLNNKPLCGLPCPNRTMKNN